VAICLINFSISLHCLLALSSKVLPNFSIKTAGGHLTRLVDSIYCAVLFVDAVCAVVNVPVCPSHSSVCLLHSSVVLVVVLVELIIKRWTVAK